MYSAILSYNINSMSTSNKRFVLRYTIIKINDKYWVWHRDIRKVDKNKNNIGNTYTYFYKMS